MKYLNKKIRAYIFLPLTMLLLGCIVFESYKSILRYDFNDNWVIHTHKVMESNARLLSNLTDAESSQRGYIITGNKDFLDLYNESKLDFLKENKILKILTADNKAQQANIDSIDHLASRRITILDNRIHTTSLQGGQVHTGAPFLLTGKKTMDSIRRMSSQINDAEQLLLKNRELASYHNYIRSQWLFFLSVLVTLVLLAAIFSMLYGQYKLKTKAQNELYNSKEWYSQTLISLGDGVIATSPDHYITYMNKAAEELTKYSLADAYLKPVETVLNITSEITGQAVTVPSRRAIAEKRVVELENHTILTRKDGSKFYIDDSAAPVYGNNGNMLGAVLVFRNITEKTLANKRLKELNDELEEKVIQRTHKLQEEIKIRKKAEKEKTKLIENLVQTNKSLEQFIYIISHNFRRPVANIMGLLNLIEKNETDTDSELNFLATEVNHLDMVLKDLGSITKILKNQTENKEVISIKEVLHVIIDSLQYEMDKIDAKIISTISNNDKVFCIKSYFSSILLNLLSNAIKYRDPQRQLVITISFRSSNSYNILSVKDNGLGFDMEKNGDKIFGLYNRFHQHIDGKGIGLHISKTQMEMMGGKIEVKSKPGDGAEFIIYFPKNTAA